MDRLHWSQMQRVSKQNQCNYMQRRYNHPVWWKSNKKPIIPPIVIAMLSFTSYSRGLSNKSMTQTHKRQIAQVTLEKYFYFQSRLKANHQFPIFIWYDFEFLLHLWIFIAPAIKWKCKIACLLGENQWNQRDNCNFSVFHFIFLVFNYFSGFFSQFSVVFFSFILFWCMVRYLWPCLSPCFPYLQHFCIVIKHLFDSSPALRNYILADCIGGVCCIDVFA